MFRGAKKMDARAKKTSQGPAARFVQLSERESRSAMRNQAKKNPAQRPQPQRESILESGYVSVPPSGSEAGAEVEIDWIKVEMLRAAIEGGSYQVDAHAVAEAMIDRAGRVG